MFDAIAILTVTGAFLIILWLSLVLARFLLRAVLASMQHCAQRGTEAVFVPMSANQPANTKVFIGESGEDSHRR